MSPSTRDRPAPTLRSSTRVFAALGDPTRADLLTKLGRGTSLPIAKLTEGSGLTRQAITKHLRVLRRAGLVRSVRHGRERRFELRPEPLDAARQALERISVQWDVALARLKDFVERR